MLFNDIPVLQLYKLFYDIACITIIHVLFWILCLSLEKNVDYFYL